MSKEADEFKIAVLAYVEAKDGVVSDDEEVHCPRAKTWMTPCIAKDGHLAEADDGRCVGCSLTASVLLADLQGRIGSTDSDS